jgi:preprotein translocase subunit SecG
MQTVVIVIHLMVVVGLIGVVLLQRSEGGGLGVGSSGGFMTNRGTRNVLTTTTAVLAGVFFCTSLILSIIAGVDRKPRSILQNSGTPASQSTPAGQTPPGEQGKGEGGGVLDQLRKGAPEEPPGGNGPTVPRSQ